MCLDASTFFNKAWLESLASEPEPVVAQPIRFFAWQPDASAFFTQPPQADVQVWAGWAEPEPEPAPTAQADAFVSLVETEMFAAALQYAHTHHTVRPRTTTRPRHRGDTPLSQRTHAFA